MAEGNNFNSTVKALFEGMDSVVSSKTVVGDAIHINGTIILPLVDVSFGIGSGSFNADKKENMIPDVMDRFSEKDEKMTEKDVMDILDSDDEA